jgi:hypothetical protein
MVSHLHRGLLDRRHAVPICKLRPEGSANQPPRHPRTLFSRLGTGLDSRSSLLNARFSLLW